MSESTGAQSVEGQGTVEDDNTVASLMLRIRPQGADRGIGAKGCNRLRIVIHANGKLWVHLDRANGERGVWKGIWDDAFGLSPDGHDGDELQPPMPGDIDGIVMRFLRTAPFYVDPVAAEDDDDQEAAG